jgi:hypothetical protein
VTPATEKSNEILDILADVSAGAGGTEGAEGPPPAVDIGTGFELVSPTAFVAVSKKSYIVLGVRPVAVPVYTVPTAVNATGNLAPPPMLDSRT